MFGGRWVWEQLNFKMSFTRLASRQAVGIIPLIRISQQPSFTGRFPRLVLRFACAVEQAGNDLAEGEMEI